MFFTLFFFLTLSFCAFLILAFFTVTTIVHFSSFLTYPVSPCILSLVDSSSELPALQSFISPLFYTPFFIPLLFYPFFTTCPFSLLPVHNPSSLCPFFFYICPLFFLPSHPSCVLLLFVNSPSLFTPPFTLRIVNYWMSCNVQVGVYKSQVLQ